jgi:hypothetical protein
MPCDFFNFNNKTWGMKIFLIPCKAPVDAQVDPRNFFQIMVPVELLQLTRLSYR